MSNAVPQLLRYDLGVGAVAFSTTRHGGVSTGRYAAFNINEYCGDLPDAVRANRLSLCQLLGVGADRLVVPHQVHGTVVRRLATDFLQLDAAQRRQLLEGVDAVMTDVPQLCVGVSTADCIPVLLYDAACGAVCAVHAGWRGTVQRIVQAAVGAMRAAYGTRPSALRAIIGPGISLSAFEVGDEVYEQFRVADFDMLHLARRYPVRTSTNHTAEGAQPSPPAMKWHIDLWECNRQQLLDCGVSADRVTWPASAPMRAVLISSPPADWVSTLDESILQ